MTCQSSESAETIEGSSRANDTSRAVESDESRIALAMKDLKNTGWYWGSLTANEAKEILQDASEGTFLLRDSSQRDYLFTISAMTSAGPTNLRIEYKHGKFKLDSVVLVKPKLKQFDSVVHLVEHYMHLSRTSDKAPPHSQPVATPATAAAAAVVPNGTVQLLLTRPVYMSMPSLQHLCRIAINRRTQQVQDLPLPNRLKDYLTDYSFHV
ncbi:uncharacterized protein V6R79_015914 [Siganus canaliculatus]